ncbi:MAG TPA: M36 family metallopeptidase, partial [bacterium]|nr:M36 family metallopeptidase [bacterium]
MSYADYVQTFHGLEVVDSFVGVRFKNGKHVLTTSEIYPDVSVNTTPVIDGAAAEKVAIASLAAAGVNGLTLENRSELVIYPVTAGASVTYRLAWRNRVVSTSPVGRWDSIVAADGTNDLLMRHNRVAFAVGEFQTQIEPRYIGQTPVATRARGVAVGGASTNGDGQWETAAGSMTVKNAGPYFTVDNQAGATSTKSLNVTGSGMEQFMWASTEAPLEELDPFAYANQSNERQRLIAPDVNWYYAALPIHTNVNGTCNAYYDGASLNFFPTGGGCNATSRIADVIYHEYGHGNHDHLSPQGLDQTAAEIQEGVADTYAHEITNDPNLGPYFFPGQQAGIRNATDVRTYPSGVQGNNSEVHESGKIWTNMFWLIRVEFLRKQGAQYGGWAFHKFHSDTLRGAPHYTTAYQEAIAADDDDGNPANGTPNSCEINAIFSSHGLLPGQNGVGGTAAAVRGYLALSHTQPAIAAPGKDLALSLSIQSLSQTCGDLDPTSVTVHYKVNGAAEQTATLTGSGTSFTGAIPAQAEKTVVTYWFSAKETAQGAQFTAPLNAPANFYTAYFGSQNTVFTDDFESDKGWTHSADAASHDDWERGAPNGSYFDPTAAHSGSSAIGNDLGLDGKNGLYESGVDNWIESPAIDCSKCKGARLQFWRNLDVGAGDVATVKVNGTAVWTSETSGRNDLGWTFVDADISSLADGKSVTVRFELQSDGKIERSGWTIDDVAVMADQGGTPGPGPGPGNSAVGDSLNGGCRCTVGATQAPGASMLWAALTGVAALGAVVARRKRG